MRYLAVAIDFDGTLARDDRVPDAAVAALQRLRTSGRRAILVTGRRVDHLLEHCTCVELFTRVVAENGAVLYDPRTRERTGLTDPLPARLLDALRDRGWTRWRSVRCWSALRPITVPRFRTSSGSLAWRCR